MDLDLELGESALVLGIQPRFSFVDFVENFRRMDASLLESYIEHHPSGIHLLSAPVHPEKAESVTAEHVRRILAFLRQHYDYIIVDTPRSFASSTLAIFEQADLVFIVSTADLPSLRNIQRGMPLLKKVLTKGEEQVRLILNRYDPNDSDLGCRRREESGSQGVLEDQQRLRGSDGVGQRRKADRPQRRVAIHP